MNSADARIVRRGEQAPDVQLCQMHPGHAQPSTNTQVPLSYLSLIDDRTPRGPHCALAICFARAPS